MHLIDKIGRGPRIKLTATKEKVRSIMKKTYTVMSIVAGAIIMSALPALAEEAATAHQVICQNNSDSIQERIGRLDREIVRGTAVYSPEELKKLQKERSDAGKIRDYVNNNEPSGSL
ncbi:hypothetical protein [Geobacter sp. FeAm09]|uniref:hypothetical protein n=1 Tax=Geobacter sp. FeAm09 TaxID=2597769 RepID=UPI00197AB549|nr:hypothetical protein [Geobacter sp. FeAm09]